MTLNTQNSFFFTMKQLFIFLAKCISVVLLSIGLFLLALLIKAQRNSYKPPQEETLAQVGNAQKKAGNIVTLVTWNIGFTGFGKESDFFYDGGKRVFAKPAWATKNFEGVRDFMSSYTDVDLFLLQEIDIKAQRSHHRNQVDLLADALPDYNYTFATNYKVDFVPYPFYQPLGQVHSGIATYSKFAATQNIRHQFKGDLMWPRSLYLPKRCFLLQRFALQNGKNLVLVNTHNSAYDNGSLKKQQMDTLRTILLQEYEQGNYVIIGGDWNQTPPGFDNNSFLKVGMQPSPQIPIAQNYMPNNWQWVYDPSIPTNRKLDEPYNSNRTFSTVIDFFLISPNIDLISVKGIDQQFEFSDHQPVYMKVRLH